MHKIIIQSKIVEQEFEQHFKHFVVIAKDVVGAERG
jgi:hypothetical protein